MTPRDQNVRTWSMLCHLSALAGLIFGLGNVLGPLLVWQIKKNELPEIDPHGKEALNFQLTVLLINIVVFVAVASVAGSFWGFGHFIRSPFSISASGLGIGAVLMIVNLLALILAVIAGLKANNGEHYKYPFTIRFVK